MRIAILDLAAGISGDMTLGALLSLGLPASWLEELPKRLGVANVGVTVRDVPRAGITCKPDGVPNSSNSTLLLGSYVSRNDAMTITNTIPIARPRRSLSAEKNHAAAPTAR